MANIKSIDYANPPLCIGDNEFETAVVTVAANTTLYKGSVLIRQSSGKFAAVVVTPGTPPTSTLAADAGVAILVEDLTNATGSSVDNNVRVMIAGKVNRNLLNAAEEALTDAECDILRSQSIIAIPVNAA